MQTSSKTTFLRDLAIGSFFVAMILAAGAILTSSGPTANAMTANPDWGPKWTNGGELVLPKNYHEWVFMGAPLTPHALNGGNAPFPEFHNVYVQREAFSAYKETGDFPEGTIILKELQLTRKAAFEDGSSVEVSGRGYFPGARNGIDIMVKDSQRFTKSNSWGFFNFGHSAPPYAKTAKEQPIDACAGCHIANADRMVFRKFYAPILDADTD